MELRLRGYLLPKSKDPGYKVLFNTKQVAPQYHSHILVTQLPEMSIEKINVVYSNRHLYPTDNQWRRKISIKGAHIHIFELTYLENNRFKKHLIMQNTNI